MSVTAERLMVEVQADVRQALRELNKVDDQASKSSSRFGKMKAGLVGAFSGAAVAGGIVKTIGLAKSFDLTMRQVGTQTGQTGEKLKGLSDLAMKMGADTAFSAQDASDAMLELAKGGLSAAQIKAGALKDTLTLAAAGGLDMGSSAGYMTQALNTFGLKADQGSQIAAALAGGANASTASVESLGQALSQVGPGAANAGMSLQETVAALAAFDNAGIKGSDAGTSLKTMLTSLVPATAAAKGAMSDYGLEFVNADGSMKSMTQVAQELKEGLGGLSDAERTNALRTIFGSDATRAATVMMKEGAKGVQGYIKATKDQSTVQKMANTAMGGAEGAWNQLTGSLETLAIKVGSALLPAFTKAAEGGAAFINWIGTLGGELQEAVSWVKGFVSGFLAPFKPALAPLAGLFGAAAGGASKMGAVLKPVAQFIQLNSKAFGAAAGIITAIFIPAMVRAGVSATVAKAKVVGAFIAKTAAAVKHAAMAGPAMVRMGVFYVQYAAVSTAQAARVVASWVAQQAAVARSVAVQVAQMARLGAAYVAASARMVASMAATAARTAASWAMMAGRALASAARMAASWVIAMGPIGWAIAAVIGLVVVIVKNWDKIKAVTAKVFGWLGGFVKTIWGGIKSGVSSAVGAVKGAVTGAWNAIKGVTSSIWNGVKSVVASVWGGIKSVVATAVNYVKTSIQGWKVIIGWVTGFFGKAKDGAAKVLDSLIGFVKGIPGRILSGLGNLGNLLLGAGKDIIQGLLDGISSMIGSVRSKLTDLTNLLPDWKGPRSKDKKLLTPAGKAIMESLMDGFQGQFPAIQRQLEGLTKRIEDTYSTAADRVNANANAAISKAQDKLKGQAETAALTRIRKGRDATLSKLSDEKDRMMEAAKAYGERLENFKGVVDSMAEGFGDTWEDAEKKLAEVRKGVAAAFTGKTQAAWLSSIDSMNGQLRGLYAARVALVGKMEDAQRRLDDLNQAKSDFVGSVFSGMAGQANVTNAGNSAATIAASLGDQVAKVKRFSDILGQLRSQGFSDAVVMQVASAGVEGGWQAANALIAANSSQVASINSSMAGITAQATATSAALGSQMYDAGIQGATSTLQGLQSQYDAVTAGITTMGNQLSAALEAALSSGLTKGGIQAGKGLAAGLEGERKNLRRLAKDIGDEIGDELRRALQVRSPSRVTMAIGRFVGLGLGKGILGQVAAVRKSAATLGRSAVPTVPALGLADTYARTPDPSLAGLTGGQRAGSSVSFHFTTHNPVAEPESRTTNKALDRAGSLGLL